MALGDDFIEVLRLGGGHDLEPEIVNDQEVEGQVPAQLRLPGVIRPGRLKRAEELGGLEEEGRAALPARLMAQRLGHVCLIAAIRMPS